MHNDETIRQALSIVELGLDAKKFLESNVGQYIISQAQSEVDEASRKLRAVEPTSVGEIINLQIEARVAERAVLWLAEAIMRGQKTEEQLILEEGETYE